MPLWLDRGDLLGDELHVGTFQGGQEVGAEQHSLAAEGVVGPGLGAQLRVRQLGAHEGGRAGGADAPDGVWVADGGGQRLAVLEDEAPPGPLQAGDVFDGQPQESRVGAVAPRHEPVAGALEDVQAADLGRDLGHELHGAGAAADDADALAGEVVVVVPLGGVEEAPGEGAVALDGGDVGLVQLPRGEHQRVGLEGLARSVCADPAAALLIPGAGADGLTEADQPLDAVLAGDVAQVVVDLALGGAQPAPVAPLGEGEGVEVAGHVAGGAGVAVVEPGAAEVGRLLEDRDVPDAVPRSSMAAAMPPKPAPTIRTRGPLSVVVDCGLKDTLALLGYMASCRCQPYALAGAPACRRVRGADGRRARAGAPTRAASPGLSGRAAAGRRRRWSARRIPSMGRRR